MTYILLFPTDDVNVFSVIDSADAPFEVALPLHWIEVLEAPKPWQRTWSTSFNAYIGEKPPPNYDLVPIFHF